MITESLSRWVLIGIFTISISGFIYLWKKIKDSENTIPKTIEEKENQ